MISLQAAPAQRLQCTDAGHMEPALAAFTDYYLTETDWGAVRTVPEVVVIELAQRANHVFVVLADVSETSVGA